MFTHISSYVGGTSLLSTLKENLRCGLECGYALPRLFSPSFFLANSKLHFYSLLLQKTTFTGLKAKDVYHSHPYLKDIIWLLEQTHLWASVHISTHVAVIYASRPNKRLIICQCKGRIKKPESRKCPLIFSVRFYVRYGGGVNLLPVASSNIS